MKLTRTQTAAKWLWYFNVGFMWFDLWAALAMVASWGPQ